MTDNSYIPASSLTFQGYKDSLKTFLRNQEQFTDVDFEGSNINVLLDILTYNTINHAHYLNMVGSEAFLDSSQLRESIVSHAKSLNYVPRSRVSARSTVTIQIYPSDSPETIVIPKYYYVKTNNTSGATMMFSTSEPIIVPRDGNGNYVKTGIDVYEGQVVREYFDVSSVVTESGYTRYDSEFVINSENVDISSLEIFVYPNSLSDVPVQHTRAIDTIGLTNSSEIYFVVGHKANQYRIEFGDGYLGKAVNNGAIVEVVYRDTVGAEGNGRLSFTKTAAIQGYGVVTVTTTEIANGGAERESNAIIARNAPRYFQTQNRAVISQDFLTLLGQNFPEVQASYVYGGEEVKKWGKVIVVVKPFGVRGRASASLKARIKTFLDSKTITTESVIEDPVYHVLAVTAQVDYNANQVSTNTDTVRTRILSALATYNNDQLNQFGISIYASSIENVITSSDPAIKGCTSSIALVNQWIPTQVNVQQTVSFSYGNPLNNDSVTTRAMKSTNFFIRDPDDSIKEVYITDNRSGVLQLIEVESAAVYNQNIGTINYTTGEVSFVLTVQGYNTTSIDLYAQLARRYVDVRLNKFVILDTSYANLTMNPIV